MKLEFWFEFGSTYSYPAAMRIENLAQEKGVKLEWCPFLLGPIFKSHCKLPTFIGCGIRSDT